MEPYRERSARQRALLREALEEICRFASRTPSIRRIFVFGSFAKNAVGPTSDLDLLVIRETNASRWERSADIERTVRLRVGLDITVVTPEEYRDVLPTTTFGATILAESVLAYAG